MRILVVDDDVRLCSMIERGLTEEGGGRFEETLGEFVTSYTQADDGYDVEATWKIEQAAHRRRVDRRGCSLDWSSGW